MNVFWGILESACLSVRPRVHVSIGVQNATFCQSAGGGIKSHSVTVLVKSWSQSFRRALKFHTKCKRLMTLAYIQVTQYLHLL